MKAHGNMGAKVYIFAATALGVGRVASLMLG